MEGFAPYTPDRWDDKTMMQVRDGELMFFRRPPDRSNLTPEQLEKQRLKLIESRKGGDLYAGAYSGAMTLGARKRMTKAVTLLCQATKPKWITNPVNGKMQYHKLSFLTLTVSSEKNITAKECYTLVLQHFIQWLRRTKKVTSYIWKAELQQRGQIHYHFIFPEFIHYREIRTEWNNLQRRAGLLDNYAQKYKHADPNSTDIHEMKNVRKTAKYVCKELGKDIDAIKVKQKKEIQNDLKAGLISQELANQLLQQLEENKFFTEGKIWDCSDNLSSMGYFTTVLTPAQNAKITYWIQVNKEHALINEYWCVVDLQTNSPPNVLSVAEKKLFENHLDIVRLGGKKYLKQVELFLN